MREYDARIFVDERIAVWEEAGYSNDAADALAHYELDEYLDKTDQEIEFE